MRGELAAIRGVGGSIRSWWQLGSEFRLLSHVSLDVDVDELLHGGVEVTVLGLGGELLDSACIQQDTWN